MTATDAPEVIPNAHLAAHEAPLRAGYVPDEVKPQALVPYTIDAQGEADLGIAAKIVALRALPGPSRIRAAQAAARLHYPGPVGEMLEQVIGDWGAFGYRLGSHPLMNRLLDNLLARDEGVVHRCEVE